ncbi:MAG: bifunctional ADP-dependent NAD(P)H-hydrate dehydratase/NAD(P)H-hydrate epimerase, partial [Cyclobacteriaceae bacterium]|nr:bifunctional ADP-dependent NAD(P)H-hydrate dehydratase/NAD(P)H-hydrate epimerase [Cyclobacteriaceae bacterium HetDA_MAG_MS6]
MIPILSAEQIRQVDQYTIENEPVRSIDLMERASRAFVEKLYQLYSELGQVVVLAGTGNNGGDALAIARMLMENRVNVSILIVGNPELGSKDFQVNYGRFRNKVDLSIMDAESSPPDLSGFSLIIDGIFGSGLSRPVEGWRADLFAMVNRSGIELV